MMKTPPNYDKSGLHVLDPNDKRGSKSAYITLLQEKALRRYLPEGTGGLGVDLGCGYGRLTPILSEKGWKSVGIDPSPELLNYAREHYAGPDYREGGLPDLPLEPESVSILLIQNILRALKMMGYLEYIQGIGRYIALNGKLFLVENIRNKHIDFLSEEQITQIMEKEGLALKRRVPIRAGRWWMIYLIRYGLIPPRFFDAISNWELSRMAHRTDVPKNQYWNVLFIFEKQAPGVNSNKT